MQTMLRLRVPSIAVVIGEGSSGGALALGVTGVMGCTGPTTPDDKGDDDDDDAVGTHSYYTHSVGDDDDDDGYRGDEVYAFLFDTQFTVDGGGLTEAIIGGIYITEDFFDDPYDATRSCFIYVSGGPESYGVLDAGTPTAALDPKIGLDLKKLTFDTDCDDVFGVDPYGALNIIAVDLAAAMAASLSSDMEDAIDAYGYTGDVYGSHWWVPQLGDYNFGLGGFGEDAAGNPILYEDISATGIVPDGSYLMFGPGGTIPAGWFEYP
jgi:hypothetical protein